MGEEYDFGGEDWPGVKVAADIEGELAQLERALRAVEAACELVNEVTGNRLAAEQAINSSTPEWRNRSIRLDCLERGAKELRYASLELSRAMAASTTKTDEMPF